MVLCLVSVVNAHVEIIIPKGEDWERFCQPKPSGCERHTSGVKVNYQMNSLAFSSPALKNKPNYTKVKLQLYNLCWVNAVDYCLYFILFYFFFLLLFRCMLLKPEAHRCVATCLYHFSSLFNFSTVVVKSYYQCIDRDFTKLPNCY